LAQGWASRRQRLPLVGLRRLRQLEWPVGLVAWERQGPLEPQVLDSRVAQVQEPALVLLAEPLVQALVPQEPEQLRVPPLGPLSRLMPPVQALAVS
jgi:hypothetical protein